MSENLNFYYKNNPPDPPRHGYGPPDPLGLKPPGELKENPGPKPLPGKISMGHIETPIDRHTDTPMYQDVPGSLFPGTKISFLVAHEAKRLA